jgi:hypothetical protein
MRIKKVVGEPGPNTTSIIEFVGGPILVAGIILAILFLPWC